MLCFASFTTYLTIAAATIFVACLMRCKVCYARVSVLLRRLEAATIQLDDAVRPCDTYQVTSLDEADSQ